MDLDDLLQRLDADGREPAGAACVVRPDGSREEALVGDRARDALAYDDRDALVALLAWSAPAQPVPPSPSTR